ncbi:hypothetical protein SDC9_61157 [bioreactor metagenome]|uniref:Antirestriction protein ArdA n=1 Tax=bioreactor metagenome TaxID=1076179 RepID=A0A644XKN5_9ZZZZ
MPEKEKVMVVTLMRSDLYDAAGYAGAYLKLPAGRDVIQDAMDRARIRDGQPYKIVECFNSQGDELSFIPDDPSLAEMNFLARRVSEMNEHDRIAFTGCARMGNGNMGMRDLINQMYNLDDAHAVPAKNDRELGKFYVDNDFIDAVNHVPPEYQKELLELLDYEKIGCRQRESEGGIYHNGFYVVNGSGSWNPVYDGVHLPELPEEPAYVFKLQLAEASFTLDNPEPEHSVPLLLPASDEEILAALERLGAASLDECVFHHCDSPIPALEQAFSFSEDIDKMNLLAERIRELEQNGELPKFKAALETACCADIGQALNLTRNLDCYDFHPELSSMEDYAMQKFLDRYQIPKDAPELKLIRFSRLDFKVMEETNLYTTAYGIIRRNDREMELEYTQPEAGQKMV